MHTDLFRSATLGSPCTAPRECKERWSSATPREQLDEQHISKLGLGSSWRAASTMKHERFCSNTASKQRSTGSLSLGNPGERRSRPPSERSPQRPRKRDPRAIIHLSSEHSEKDHRMGRKNHEHALRVPKRKGWEPKANYHEEQEVSHLTILLAEVRGCTHGGVPQAIRAARQWSVLVRGG